MLVGGGVTRAGANDLVVRLADQYAIPMITAYGRNDAVPNHLYLSPRLGFSWAYGTAPQVEGFLGAVRGPRAVVRGGVGVFQNTPATPLIGSALENTGPVHEYAPGSWGPKEAQRLVNGSGSLPAAKG